MTSLRRRHGCTWCKLGNNTGLFFISYCFLSLFHHGLPPPQSFVSPHLPPSLVIVTAAQTSQGSAVDQSVWAAWRLPPLFFFSLWSFDVSVVVVVVVCSGAVALMIATQGLRFCFIWTKCTHRTHHFLQPEHASELTPLVLCMRAGHSAYVQKWNTDTNTSDHCLSVGLNVDQRGAHRAVSFPFTNVTLKRKRLNCSTQT